MRLWIGPEPAQYMDELKCLDLIGAYSTKRHDSENQGEESTLSSCRFLSQKHKISEYLPMGPHTNWIHHLSLSISEFWIQDALFLYTLVALSIDFWTPSHSLSRFLMYIPNFWITNSENKKLKSGVEDFKLGHFSRLGASNQEHNHNWEVGCSNHSCWIKLDVIFIFTEKFIPT